MNHVRRVVVVGSLNLDTIYAVDSLPAPGETVSATTGTRCVGGKGGNQAVAAASAGAVTKMIGCVGSDPAGEEITARLRECGVDVSGVSRSPVTPTGQACVIVSEDGENCILVVAGANTDLTPESVELAMADVVAEDIVLLQNEIPPQTSARAAEVAARIGAHVVWNAAPAPRSAGELPRHLDTVVVNEGELHALATHLGRPSDDVEHEAASVARDLDAHVVCTLGPDGAIFSDGDKTSRHSAPRVRAVDTTAAGDTFTGYYAAHVHEPVGERLSWATTAGAQAVTRPGASPSIPPQHLVAELLHANELKVSS